MKKRPTFSFLVLCLLFGYTLVGKTPGPIAVSTNDYTTITFFFPENIMKVVAPASHFSFEYAPDSNMATLKGVNGATSNLTVITENGYIYSFLLNYAKEVLHFTYVLSSEESIGTLPVTVIGTSEYGTIGRPQSVAMKEGSPMSLGPDSRMQFKDEEAPGLTGEHIEATEYTDSALVEKSTTKIDHDAKVEVGDLRSDMTFGQGDMYELDRLDYYQIFCENNYLQKNKFRAYGMSIKEIGLTLTNIIADREELYFVLDIQNESVEDFKLKQLELFVKSRVEGTKLPVEVLHAFKVPETIAGQTVHQLIMVVKKFKLAEHQNVYALLEESQGGQRTVMLPFQSRDINRL